MLPEFGNDLVNCFNHDVGAVALDVIPAILRDDAPAASRKLREFLLHVFKLTVRIGLQISRNIGGWWLRRCESTRLAERRISGIACPAGLGSTLAKCTALIAFSRALSNVHSAARRAAESPQ